MKCKDCAMFVWLGKCECGRDIYACLEGDMGLVEPGMDGCDGIDE